jgi:hypothetical protein
MLASSQPGCRRSGKEVSNMRIRSVLTHSGQAVLEGALIAMLIVGLMAGTAFAAKGGGKPGGGATGTLAVVMVKDLNGNQAPNYADTITFNVSSTADMPMVNLNCTQNGDWVTNQSVGFYDGWPWSQNFPLETWKWTGGAADCTATLYYQNRKGSHTIATATFRAGG